MLEPAEMIGYVLMIPELVTIQVRVIGNEKLIKTTGLGEYWRPLAPGSYQVVAEAPGFEPSEVVNVNIREGSEPPQAQIHRFVLHPTE